MASMSVRLKNPTASPLFQNPTRRRFTPSNLIPLTRRRFTPMVTSNLNPIPSIPQPLSKPTSQLLQYFAAAVPTSQLKCKVHPMVSGILDRVNEISGLDKSLDLVLPWLLLCFLVPRALSKVYDIVGRKDVPFERSAWGALQSPLIFLLLYFYSTTVPWAKIVHSQFVASERSFALVLSLAWFLYQWRSNFIKNSLERLEARGAHPSETVSIKNFSISSAIYIGVLLYFQLVGGALEYILLSVVVTGFSVSSSYGAIVGKLLTDLLEQSQEDSSLDDSFMKTAKSTGQPSSFGADRLRNDSLN